MKKKKGRGVGETVGVSEKPKVVSSEREFSLPVAFPVMESVHLVDKKGETTCGMMPMSFNCKGMQRIIISTIEDKNFESKDAKMLLDEYFKFRIADLLEIESLPFIRKKKHPDTPENRKRFGFKTLK